MEFRDTPEEHAWRTTVQDFLKKDAPEVFTGARGGGRMGGGGGASNWEAAFDEWRGKVAAQGWLAPHWPKEYGGAAMTHMQQFIMKEEFALNRAPHPGGRGVDMVGPTIILHGSDQQKEDFLPPILHGEHVYCQGFSEPGAGSDLASLQLRAARDGDDYVLNGQKIWTSNATTCNWMFLLARTDPDAPKHRGISYFVTPVQIPGLTVRTIPDMSGGHDLCETFFDNVRIPARNRIGDENRGWYVAMTTLDFERSGIAGAVSVQQSVVDIIEMVRGNCSDAQRHYLAELYIGCEVARQMSYYVASLQTRGQVPNHESSMIKLFSSELRRRLDVGAVNLFGLAGILRYGSNGREIADGRIARSLSGSIPMTIAGGSSEVQRGIIATRGLGLPRG